MQRSYRDSAFGIWDSSDFTFRSGAEFVPTRIRRGGTRRPERPNPESHDHIIQEWPPNRRVHIRANCRPGAAADGGVPADSAAAGDQSAALDRIGQPRAGRRSAVFPHAAEHRRDDPDAPISCDRSAPSPPSGRWPRCPNGGMHVIVEGLARAKSGRRDANRAPRCGDGRAAAGGGRAHDRSRRVRAAAAGADRSRAVGDQRAVAGAARPGRRASTTRCGLPTCSRACST